MNNNKLKTIVFSLGLAAMMLPTTNLTAQTGGGIFERGFVSGEADYGSRGVMNINDNTGDGITNDGFGETPLGSGIAILIGAGLGYVALKKKEDGQ